MVTRKGFFSYIGLALLGALGSSALAASPPRFKAKCLNLDGSEPKRGADGLIHGSAPQAPECFLTIYDKHSTLRRGLCGVWRGPLDGYVALCPEIRQSWTAGDENWIDALGLEEWATPPSATKGDIWFGLSAAAKQSAVPIVTKPGTPQAWEIRPLVSANVPSDAGRPQTDFRTMDGEMLHGHPVLFYTGTQERFMGFRPAYFGLFSFEGNMIVTQLVDVVSGCVSSNYRGSVPKFNSEKFIYHLVEIAKKHPEVFDTVVRDKVYYSLNPCSDASTQTLIAQSYYQALNKFYEKYTIPPGVLTQAYKNGGWECLPTATPSGFSLRTEVTVPRQLG